MNVVHQASCFLITLRMDKFLAVIVVCKGKADKEAEPYYVGLRGLMLTPVDFKNLAIILLRVTYYSNFISTVMSRKVLGYLLGVFYI